MHCPKAGRDGVALVVFLLSCTMVLGGAATEEDAKAPAEDAADDKEVEPTAPPAKTQVRSLSDADLYDALRDIATLLGVRSDTAKRRLLVSFVRAAVADNEAAIGSAHYASVLTHMCRMKNIKEPKAVADLTALAAKPSFDTARDPDYRSLTNWLAPAVDPSLTGEKMRLYIDLAAAKPADLSTPQRDEVLRVVGDAHGGIAAKRVGAYLSLAALTKSGVRDDMEKGQSWKSGWCLAIAIWVLRDR